MELEYEIDDDERRIMGILSPDKELDELPFVTAETLAMYHQFLVKHLTENILLTGRESAGYFSWEEKYEFGGGNEVEYKKLLHTKASYQETFQLIALSSVDDEWGSIAQVLRVRDKKKFDVPLADLEVCKKTETEWRIVEDYGMWMTNYQD